MFLVTTNRLKRLLHLSYVGHVRLEDLESSRQEILTLLDELPAGFRLLTDLSALQAMDTACEAQISWMMECLDEKGMSLVVRVIPEPDKDIGFNILAAFHYRREIKNITCKTMEEALRVLAS